MLPGRLWRPEGGDVYKMSGGGGGARGLRATREAGCMAGHEKSSWQNKPKQSFACSSYCERRLLTDLTERWCLETRPDQVTVQHEISAEWLTTNSLLINTKTFRKYEKGFVETEESTWSRRPTKSSDVRYVSLSWMRAACSSLITYSPLLSPITSSGHIGPSLRFCNVTSRLRGKKCVSSNQSADDQQVMHVFKHTARKQARAHSWLHGTFSVMSWTKSLGTFPANRILSNLQSELGMMQSASEHPIRIRLVG